MTAPPPVRLGTAAQSSSTARFHPVVQTQLEISSPQDSAEREAVTTARRVTQMRSPPAFRIGRAPAPSTVARFPVQCAGDGKPVVSPGVEAEVQASRSGGIPLSPKVRQYMEPRFRADFSAVRLHTDTRAGALSRKMRARAFTVGAHIFFAPGQYQPDTPQGRELLAHELTHTIQQGVAPQGRSRLQRSEDATVTHRTPVQVQRWGISDALDFFADKANMIPGFRMLTIVLGVNPINMRSVARSAANILRALIELLPMGGLITQALESSGIFDKAGAFVEAQIDSLGMVGGTFRQAVMDFLDSLSWSDIFDLGGVWNRAKRIFTAPIDQIISFATGLVSGIVDLVKEAILRPIAQLAEGTEGYALLKAVLGYDPITGDPYPRTAETLIGPFMRLIGQEEIWENIQRANAIPRAFAWFQGALSGLLGFVSRIPDLFISAFQSLELMDIVLVPRAFAKLASVFGGFLGEFFSWAGSTIFNLLEIIFDVVAPQVMVYVRRAASAFRTIIRDPIGFVRNLVRAGIQGLRQFARNFLSHLRASLIGWLTGAMSGANIYIPQGFNLREILKFVLSVLGLTWQNIRSKLVRALGERVVVALETGFDLVVTLVRDGPAAAWQKIVEGISNLRDMVIEQVMTFVRDRVVQAAITRLVTSLNPAGAFIQAILAIYNTVMFFVERLRQIAQVAAAFIDSIAAIASGVIATAANRVEQTMAGLLTLVISFLARIAGLGRVSDAVIRIINRVRQPIDRALDRVVNWIRDRARSFLSRILGGDPNASPGQRLDRAMTEGVAAVNRLSGSTLGQAAINPVLGAIRLRHRVRRLESVEVNGLWHVLGENSPQQRRSTSKRAGAAQDGSTRQRAIDIAWVKPPVSGYPAIRIADPRIVNPAYTQGRSINLATTRRVSVTSGHTTTLINGMVIGVTNSTSKNLRVGYVFQAAAQVTGNSEKDRMNRVLSTHYGYDRADGAGAARDNDHVWEKQLGGPDALSNLWPLNQGTNRSSGSTIRGEISRVRTELGIPSLNGKWIRLKAPG